MKEQQSRIIQKPASSKTLQKYKKRLLLQVIAIFVICLIVILERIFYQVIIQAQQVILSQFQLSSDLTDKSATDRTIAGEITNGFLQFFGRLSQFRIQFLILTHLLAILYTSVDAYITTKVLYVTMGLIYLVSVIQMFYTGARPYWTSADILSSRCLESYNHPSLGLILIIFVPYYTYYCFKKKSGNVFISPIKTKDLVIFIVAFVLIFFIQFINYFIGTIFIINIAISIVFSALLIMIMISINNLVDKTIKKSTVIKLDAKKYVFYWLLLICLLETFVLIVYSGADIFLNIDWVKNFITCTDYQSYDQKAYRYDEVIGPWFNFLQTTNMFGWIGAVFGISSCFRNMEDSEWSEGPLKNRIIRGLIANLMIIPSWIFILLIEENGAWVLDIGLNEYIVDAIHFFILYFWIFGYMPVLVLRKWLKITYKGSEDYYVILQDKK